MMMMMMIKLARIAFGQGIEWIKEKICKKWIIFKLIFNQINNI